MPTIDEIILSLQRSIDRFIRRLRRGGAPEVSQRRFLIVQIDGLSRSILDRALASGRMPFLKRLTRDKHYRMQDMAVGLPTAAAAGAMFDLDHRRMSAPVNTQP